MPLKFKKTTESEMADQIIALIERLESRLAYIRVDVDRNYKYLDLPQVWKMLYKVYKIII